MALSYLADAAPLTILDQSGSDGCFCWELLNVNLKWYIHSLLSTISGPGSFVGCILSLCTVVCCCRKSWSLNVTMSGSCVFFTKTQFVRQEKNLQQWWLAVSLIYLIWQSNSKEPQIIQLAEVVTIYTLSQSNRVCLSEIQYCCFIFFLIYCYFTFCNPLKMHWQ